MELLKFPRKKGFHERDCSEELDELLKKIKL
jgi:hypothetical protein